MGMDFFGTKDHGEREDEEAERLVRPLPKYKPPRKDRRREDMETDRDPDTDGDPDLKNDPDLSLNYKSIGGAVDLVRRVVGGYREALEGPKKYVSVFDQDEKKVVSVPEQTAKNNPTRYKPVKDKEKGEEKAPESKKPEAPKEEAPKAEAPKKDEPDLAAHGEALRELAKSDPKLENTFKLLTNPKADLAGLAEQNPHLPAKTIFPNTKLPEGLNTLGDVVKALRAPKPAKPKPAKPPKAPAGEAPKAPPKQEAPKQEAPRAEPPAAKEETKPPAGETKPPAAETNPAPGETKPPAGETPPAGQTPPAQQPQPSKDEQLAARVRQRFQEKGYQNHPEFKEYAKNLPTTDDDGNFYDPKTKQRVPFEKLDPQEQSKLINDFASKKKRKTLDSKLDELDPEAKKAIQSLSDPKSDLSKKIQQYQSEGHPLEAISVEKLIPALKGKQLPIKSVADLQGAAAGLAEREKSKTDQQKKEDAKKRKELTAHNFEPPKRPEPTHAEKYQAMQSVFGLKPEPPLEVQAQLLRLHPVDLKTALASFSKFKSVDAPKSARKEIEDAAATYVSNPFKVKTLPKKGEVKVIDPETGKETVKQVDFKKLTAEQKAEAVQAHRMEHLGASIATRQRVAQALEADGVPGHLAPTFAHAALKAAGMPPEQKAKLGNKWATNLFVKASVGYEQEREEESRFGLLSRTVKKPLLGDEERSKFVKALKKLDPVSQRVGVAALQGEDYRAAHDKFLDPKSRDAISPRDTPEVIAKKLTSAKDMIQKAGRHYPAEAKSFFDPAIQFSARVRKMLQDQDPQKAAKVSDAISVIEWTAYDKAKAEWVDADKHNKKKQKAAEKEHVAWQKRKEKHEAKHRKDPYRAPPFDEPEPQLIPDLEPPKPPSGFHPEGKGDKAKAKEDLKRLRRNASLYSSYGLQKWQMGTSTPSIQDARRAVRTALYHGVEPYPKGHEGFAPYPKWNQVHQCDLGASDYDAILKAAKTWLKSPVLTKGVEGMVPDARFRAALDLAIKDSGYDRAIAPPIYNMILAKLASQPADETLLTVHEASRRVAFSTEETEGNAMTVKFAKDQANAILGRLDKASKFLQENYKKFGMDFDTAKAIVNDLDKTADEIEEAAFGPESLLRRQVETLAKSPNPEVAAKFAKVLQQDSDESYMKTFANPMAPHQTDSDEPYMGQFKDDQSSAVNDGKSTTGRPLAP